MRRMTILEWLTKNVRQPDEPETLLEEARRRMWSEAEWTTPGWLSGRLFKIARGTVRSGEGFHHCNAATGECSWR